MKPCATHAQQYFSGMAPRQNNTRTFHQQYLFRRSVVSRDGCSAGDLACMYVPTSFD
jgi:hypothetical protein